MTTDEQTTIIEQPRTSAVVDDLMRTLGVAQPTRSVASVDQSDPLTPSPHRLADATSAAMATFGLQIAGLAEDAGRAPQTVTVDGRDSIDQLRASYLTTVSGVAAKDLFEDPRALGNNDFYQCRDRRWIFLITTYAGLRDAVCHVLNCPPFKERIAEAAGHWDAFALEDAICAAGGVCAVVRTATEWHASDIGRHIASQPVVALERIADAPVESVAATDEWPPLGGMRVVDFTHVIAGPVSTRLLAAFGADVVHVSRPDYPDPNAMVVMTGGGKRATYADLRDPADDAAFRNLCAGSDVVVTSYRGLAKRGYGAADLAKIRPGVIVCEYQCWGSDGPWSHRGGFDQLACSATGFAHEEAVDGRPSLPPTYLLNDYLAAYLGAAGIVAALRRRAAEGGSWHIKINLARVCTWVQDLGMFDAGFGDLPRPGDPHLALHTHRTPFGDVTEPVLPVTFSGSPTPLPGTPVPLGSSPLAW